MRRIPFLLFGLALVARLIAWPFSDVVDADAVTRALIGESYMSYPGWIGDGVWPPLHFYLNGSFTLLFGSRELGSVLVNVLLGSAIVFPIYFLSRRWSNDSVAIAVALLIAFDPLVFRNSLQGLSEIPFLFFFACSFNALSAAILDAPAKAERNALTAGAFITIAAGMRYEAWLLIGLLALMLVLMDKRLLRWFLFTAVIFPMIWMITTGLAHGNLVKGLEHVLQWRTGPI
ncbi:MAG: glycosyltransferase family 39 protein, partial [Bacteroidota bacterium]|nr:glycosyltransferase family 39 protein [Bacteroidota bacterium]